MVNRYGGLQRGSTHTHITRKGNKYVLRLTLALSQHFPTSTPTAHSCTTAKLGAMSLAVRHLNLRALARATLPTLSAMSGSTTIGPFARHASMHHV